MKRFDQLEKHTDCDTAGTKPAFWVWCLELPRRFLCGGIPKVDRTSRRSEIIVHCLPGQPQDPTRCCAGTRDNEPATTMLRPRPTRFSHHVWTRADGFTLSGTKGA
jgi:hypothetical protein